MKTFLINLDRCPERLARFTEDWKSAGTPFDFERVPATDGLLSIPPTNWKNEKTSYGLTASFLGIFARLNAELCREPFLICEDDAYFAPGWWEYAEKALEEVKSIDSDWFYLNLGPDTGRSDQIQPHPVSERVGRLTHGWRSHACIYNPNNLSNILCLLGMFYETIDQIWNKLMAEHGWRKFYTTRIFLSGQRSGVSTLNGINWKQDFPEAGLMTYVCPSLREDLKPTEDFVLLSNGMFAREGVDLDRCMAVDVIEKDEYKVEGIQSSGKRDLVIDIGSHIGSFAKLWHDKNPESVIVCVEANPDNINTLKKNVGSFAHVINAVVSYEGGKLYFLKDRRMGANSSMVINQLQKEKFENRFPGGNEDFYISKEEIPRITLEEIASSFGFEELGVAKLDCEGSEQTILCKSSLIRTSRLIFGEWHDREKFFSAYNSLSGAFDLEIVRDDGVQGIFHLTRKPDDKIDCSTPLYTEEIENIFFANRTGIS